MTSKPIERNPTHAFSSDFLAAILMVIPAILIVSASAEPVKPTPNGLSPIFTDHAVLQREILVPAWGTANPGSSVKVNFNGQTKTATADETGKWMAKLNPMEADTKGTDLMVDIDSETWTRKDVLVDDVYFCSGQSNMEIGMSVKDFPSIAPDLAKADIAGLRHFRVGGFATWKPGTPENGVESSATAFNFGRKLHQQLDIPIGLVTKANPNLPALRSNPMAISLAFRKKQISSRQIPIT